MNSEIEIVYPSETGRFIGFVLDISKARKYGLGESFELISSALYDFSSCIGHARGAREARIKKKAEVESRIRKRLIDDNRKGLRKIKKAKSLVRKVAKAWKSTGLEIDLTDLPDIESKIMAMGLSDREQEVVRDQFSKTQQILETDGEQGLLKHLALRLEELETGLIEPDHAWIETNIGLGAVLVLAFCILLVAMPIFIIVTGWINLQEHGATQHSHLANTNTKEIHNLYKFKRDCQINEIKYEHRKYLWTYEEAKALMKNEGYDGCAYCMPDDHYK